MSSGHVNERQTTITKTTSCQGVGVHTGAPVTITLKPSEPYTGIHFVRTDVEANVAIVPARYDAVTETTLGTTITNEFGTSVATVEHLMAALWGCGIDNVTIEIDGPEVPIMDGSSEPFIFLIECAGIRRFEAPRQWIEVDRTIAVRDGDSFAMIEPYDGFTLDVEIDFAHQVIGRQCGFYDFSKVTFRQLLSRARTFGFETDVQKLRSMGLARGGSLDNAVVIGQNKILNEDGLRFNDEFVRHKALDCLGDYFLLGAHLRGAVTTSRPGHGINNKLMRAVMEEMGDAVAQHMLHSPAHMTAPADISKQIH